MSLHLDMLMELLRREKNEGIKPDEDLDIFMKVSDYSWLYLTVFRVVCKDYTLRFVFFSGISTRGQTNKLGSGIYTQGMCQYHLNVSIFYHLVSLSNHQ